MYKFTSYSLKIRFLQNFYDIIEISCRNIGVTLGGYIWKKQLA